MEQNIETSETIETNKIIDLKYERFGTWDFTVLTRRGRPRIHFTVELPKLNEDVLKNGVSRRGRPLGRKNTVTEPARGRGRPTKEEALKMLLGHVSQVVANPDEVRPLQESVDGLLRSLVKRAQRMEDGDVATGVALADRSNETSDEELSENIYPS